MARRIRPSSSSPLVLLLLALGALLLLLVQVRVINQTVKQSPNS
jgi:hypothetical protein